MKKIIVSFFSLLLTANLAFSGGIVTNTNQSASWTRMMVRDASTSIDAVYYNPAGLTKLSDGFHLSLSNQVLGQTKNVISDFMYLNNAPVDYEGKVSAPLFPGVYAAYKTGKLAFSFGFNPIGGGGSADFAGGLPSIEMPVSTLVPMLASTGVTGYSMNMNFSGTSVYFGVQAGVSYEVNDMISVYAGGRYVMAKNTYKGAMSDIMVTANGTEVEAKPYLEGVAAEATAGATLATSAAGQASFASGELQVAIDNNLGGNTLAELVGAGVITQGEADLVENGYTQLGGDPTDLTVTELQTGFDGFATQYTAMAAQLTGQAAQLNAVAPLMADQEADVEQTGSGFTPIVGVNLSFMEDKLNIGIKYEFKTNLELTNNTTLDVVTGVDGSSMFPDGEVTNADMPAMLSVGAKFQATDALNIHAGFHTYFDGQVGWEDVDLNIEGNSIEYALGLEYDINEKLLVSAGWLGTQPSVTENYQTDLSYSMATNSFGAGGAYKISDMITFQLGAFMTNYQTQTVGKEYDLGGIPVPFNETYEKTAVGVGFGLDFTFGGE
ncbi:MAG: hypothetical protein ABFS32_16090 [Bacteroidota bacterium]